MHLDFTYLTRVACTSCVTLVGFALLVGCSSQGGGESERSLGEQVLADLSEVESEILQDRFVTAAELDRAVTVLLACYERNGFQPDPYEPGTPATSIPVAVTAATEEELDALIPKVDTCKAEVDAIDAVWVLQNSARPERLEAAQNSFAACIVDLGIAAEGATYEEAAEAFGTVVSRVPAFDEEGNPSEAQACADILTQEAGSSALPGLADALAALDTAG